MMSYIRDLLMVALGWTIINILFVCILEGLCQ